MDTVNGVSVWTQWILYLCGHSGWCICVDTVDVVSLWTQWMLYLCGHSGCCICVDTVDVVSVWTQWTLYLCGHSGRCIIPSVRMSIAQLHNKWPASLYLVTWGTARLIAFNAWYSSHCITMQGFKIYQKFSTNPSQESTIKLFIKYLHWLFHFTDTCIYLYLSIYLSSLG